MLWRGNERLIALDLVDIDVNSYYTGHAVGCADAGHQIVVSLHGRARKNNGPLYRQTFRAA